MFRRVGRGRDPRRPRIIHRLGRIVSSALCRFCFFFAPRFFAVIDLSFIVAC